MKRILSLTILFHFSACEQSTPEEKKKEIDTMISLAYKMSDPENQNRDMNQITELYKEAEQKAELIHYKKGSMICSKNLMNIYFNFVYDNKKSIEYSYKTEKLAQELNDRDVLAHVHQLRGSALTELGLYKEAHDELQKAISYYKKERLHFRAYHTYKGLYVYYEKIQAPQDTILAYLNKSLYEIEQVREGDRDLIYPNEKYYQLSRAHMNIGLYYTGIHDPQQPVLAEKHLLKALKILEDKKLENATSKLFVLNALGRFYENQHQPQKAVSYVNKALELEKKHRQVGERLTSYMILSYSYEALKEKDLNLKYTKLYSSLLDSIATSRKNDAGKILTKLSTQKEEEHRSSIGKIVSAAFVLIALIIAASWFFVRKRSRKLKQKYEKLMSKLNEVSVSLNGETEKKSFSPMQISVETIGTILSKLEKFESSDKFLKKNINLSSLAHSLNTNQRYLTEIVKKHKGKSFSNYINGLRIEYITRKLYEDPKYREFKISYLAEECGFTSHQTFISVFKKETGVTPSYFIENLKRDGVVD